MSFSICLSNGSTLMKIQSGRTVPLNLYINSPFPVGKSSKHYVKKVFPYLRCPSLYPTVLYTLHCPPLPTPCIFLIFLPTAL